MYSLEARHIVSLWPRLAKRVSAECGRNDLRISAWVADHRNVVAQLLTHCLRVAFDAPQRDVAQVILGAAYLHLKPASTLHNGLGRELFDALPRLVSFHSCKPTGA